MLKRIVVFLYALLCYALFFCTFLYAIGFVTDRQPVRARAMRLFAGRFT